MDHETAMEKNVESTRGDMNSIYDLTKYLEARFNGVAFPSMVRWNISIVS
jgi:hypothetical protein